MSSVNLTSLIMDQKPIRVDRNSIWNFRKIMCPDEVELSFDILLFLNNLTQTQQPDLLGCFSFSSDDFLKFSNRSRSTIFNSNFKEVTLLVDGDEYVINSSFEYVLWYLAVTAFDTSKVYQKSDEKIVSVSAATFLKAFFMKIPNKKTKKRHYSVQLNPLFLTSILLQYSKVTPSDLFKIRGKRNSLYPLFNSLLALKMQPGIQNGITVYYDTIKKWSNINIVAYDYRKNVIETRARINKRLDLIASETSLKFTYQVDADNTYHIKFLTDSKSILLQQNHFNAVTAALRGNFVAFLESKQVISIGRLNDDERNELIQVLFLNYELSIPSLEYKYYFVDTVHRLFEENLPGIVPLRKVSDYADQLIDNNKKKKLN